MCDRARLRGGDLSPSIARMLHLLRISLTLCLCVAVPSCGLVGKGLRKLPWKKKKKDAPKEDAA